MTQSFKEQLSKLFRDIEIDLGATSLSVLVLESLEDAMQNLKRQDLHQFFRQLLELAEDVTQTEPRFAAIIDAFYDVLRVAYEEEIHHPKGNYPIRKQKFHRKMQQIIEEKKQEQKKIIECSKKLKVEGKGILIFDHSRTVQKVLEALKRDRHLFTVIVAEQDPDKTAAVIEALDRAKIPFRVVPAYTVVHLEDSIDMIFLGAITLKSTMEFVMDPGAYAIVSQFHLFKKEMYAFIATTKFSMWPSKKRTEIYIHIHRRAHHFKPIEFERIKFSHDRVPIHFFRKIITEQGIFTPKEMGAFYQKKSKEHQESDRKFKVNLRKLKGD